MDLCTYCGFTLDGPLHGTSNPEACRAAELKHARQRHLITLQDWLSADIEQRNAYLQADAQIDDYGKQVLAWALAFKDAGAHITEGHMFAVWKLGK